MVNSLSINGFFPIYLMVLAITFDPSQATERGTAGFLPVDHYVAANGLYSNQNTAFHHHLALSEANSGEQKTDTSSRYILIHVDGVSSHYLQQELRAGNLPNLKRGFYPQGWIGEAVTYLPSKTPMVISSVREGSSIEEGALVSWTGEDSQSGRSFSKWDTFRMMLSSKSRLAVSNLLYGTPVLDRLNGIALGNLPDFLQQYRVLEYYWYPIDTYGHFYGEEAYLHKLRVFDKHIGKLLDRLDDEVNLIIYSDHGMVFGQGVETDEILQERYPQIRSTSYPNVYLRAGEDPGKIAERIVDETPVDFTFWQNDEEEVTGYHRKGVMHFRFNPENRTYRYEFEGEDPLGYYQAGYRGEPLNADQWLELTWDLSYPLAPLKIIHLLRNPAAGDILTFLEEGKYSRTGYSDLGNHGGFTRHELSIPILVRGPNLEHMYGRQTMRLQDLMIDMAGADFHRPPDRDRHVSEVRHHIQEEWLHLRLSFSPAYRWAFGSDLTLRDTDRESLYRGWLRADIYRSYLTRLWLGGGVYGETGDRIQGELFLKHEIHIRRFSANTELSTSGNHRFTLEYRVVDPIAVQLTNFRWAGMRFYF